MKEAELRSVVIAEPERALRTLLVSAVRTLAPGASLRFALDGHSVLKLASSQVPDAILIDSDLPRTDLRGLCSRLRAAYSDVKICVMGIPAGELRPLHELGVMFVALSSRSREILAAELHTALDRPAPPRRRAPSGTKPITLTGPWRTRAAVPPASASALSAPRADSIAPGEIIGRRYLIEERLGHGGMGSVFAVRHLDLDKRFALKVLTAEHTTSASARASFLAEAKLACRLVHPNIVSVVDFGNDPRRGMFMVMELLAGSALSIAAPRLSLRRSCELLGQIADALDVLHRHDVVHGDVKTDNIMVVEEPDGPRRRMIARLIDFGLAHRISHAAGEGFVAGTPEYLAPERVGGGSPSVAADVYALGVIAYELFAGTLPFHGTVEEVLEAQLALVPPPLVLRDSKPVDPALAALVSRALDKDPARRHPTAAAFRYELNTVMNMLAFARPQKTVDDARFMLVFQHSLMAQAVLGDDGQVQLANEAFRTLVSRFEEVVERDPGVTAAIANAREQQRAVAYTHTTAAGYQLKLLFAPTDNGVHVVARALDG